MPKKKKVKKGKKAKKTKKLKKVKFQITKTKNDVAAKKTTGSNQEEKPEIKKIKKQATEK